MIFALLLTASLGMDAEAVMNKVAENALKTAKLRHERGLTGSKTESTAGGETKTYRIEMAPDGMLQRLESKDGAPALNAPRERPEHDITTLVNAMREHYNLRMASPEPSGGFYLIAFEPKNPDRPAKDDEAAVINHLKGIIWVEQHRFFVRRINGWLEDSFSVKGIGRALGASVQLDQELLGDLPVPLKSTFWVRFSKFFGAFPEERTVTVTYTYDPLPLLVPALPEAPSAMTPPQ